MKRALAYQSLCLAALVTTPASAAITTVIDQNAGSLGLSFRSFAINSSGLIAFDAGTEAANQRGIFTFNPNTNALTNVSLAVTNSTTNTVVRDYTALHLNDAGTIGLHVLFGGASAAARPQGVFAATAAGSLLVLKTGATTSVNAPVPLNNTISLIGFDDAGNALVSGRSSSTTPDNRFLLRGTGTSTLSILLDNTTPQPNVQGGGFFSFGGGIANAAGTAAAFNAVHDPGANASETGTYLLDISGGTVTTIQDEDTEPGSVYSFVATPVQMLDDGDVIYQNTGGGNNLRRFRRYDTATGSISNLFDADGDFSLFANVQYNASGQLAFSANLDPLEINGIGSVGGVFAGTDPIADEVAVVGQPLLGGIALSASRPVQTANGDIYFAYSIDTNSDGLADAAGIAKSDTRPTINSWSNTGAGDFLAAANWSEGVAPNGSGARAKLGSALTANSTITLDGAASLDALSIENANSYTILGAGSISFSGTRYSIIGALAGNHTIHVPVNISKSGAINVAGGASLTIDSPLTFGSGLYFRKNGLGDLNVRNINTASLDLGGGTLRILPNGTAAGLSVINDLGVLIVGVGSTGTLVIGELDLTNNGLIVDYAGGGTTSYDLGALVAVGRNGGTWDGPGITSSTAAANSATTAVGFAEASALGVTTFFGTPVDDSALLFRYTRLGDADLNGITNISDFARLAANFNGEATTWATGDFNFDGNTNISDFAALAANFNQSAPSDLPRASVPEPAVLSMLTISLIPFCGRRLRSR